jgi:predicted SprT family Zn-dependent metalloprotease/ribosomal protein S27AE
MTVTAKQYTDLDKAFDYFNKHLFEDRLPQCLITLQRHAKALGYHCHEKFTNRKDGSKISEIALNPDTFDDRTDIEVLSTLTHEMVHALQYVLGDPPRRGYHDKTFAILMNDIGLQASNTGEPGGKTTGQRMSHYILDGGKFEKVAGAFLLSGDKLQWNSTPILKESKERKKTREKWVCPQCVETTAWAKKTAKLACGNCMVEMVIEGEG